MVASHCLATKLTTYYGINTVVILSSCTQNSILRTQPSCICTLALASALMMKVITASSQSKVSCPEYSFPSSSLPNAVVALPAQNLLHHFAELLGLTAGAGNTQLWLSAHSAKMYFSSCQGLQHDHRNATRPMHSSQLWPAAVASCTPFLSTSCTVFRQTMGTLGAFCTRSSARFQASKKGCVAGGRLRPATSSYFSLAAEQAAVQQILSF